MDFLHSIAVNYQKGGAFMNFIAIAGMFSLVFIIERSIRLFGKFYVNGSSFMYEIQKYVLANDVDGAIRTCNASETALLPKVLKAGLQRASRSEDQIQNAIDAATLEAFPKVEKRLTYLALIANIATLLGLLGTIVGLIGGFGAVAVADPAQRQTILAASISEAMNCTAFGLIIAITTMIAHTVLANRAAKIVEDIDEHSVKLLDLLSAKKHKHSSEDALK